MSDIQETSKRELGDQIIAPGHLDPQQFVELKKLQREYPLLSQFRFPTNPNTNEPMIDLDRILVKQRRIHTANKIGMTSGRIVTQFSGGGSIYDEVINGHNNGGIMAATSVNRREVKPPAPPRGSLIFSPVLGPMVLHGFGKPIAVDDLNIDAIHQRIDELNDDPKKPVTNDEAWAMSLDENLRKSVTLRSKEVAAIGSIVMSVVDVSLLANLLTSLPAAAFRGDLGKTVVSAAVYIGIYVINLVRLNKEANIARNTGRSINDLQTFLHAMSDKVHGDLKEDLGHTEALPNALEHYGDAISPDEWRLSLFPPSHMHVDSYLAVKALMNNGKLIEYRK